MKRISSGMALKAVIEEIAEVAHYLWERGWAERNAGNLSLDITELVPKAPASLGRFPERAERITAAELAGRTFYVTAMGSRFRDIASTPEENLLMIRVARDLQGYQILGGRGGDEIRPTSELVTHLRIHGYLRRNARPQKAVLHTHPVHLTALTHLTPYSSEEAVNRLLWAMHPEVKVYLPEGVGLAPYRCPGSTALADATVRSLRRHRVVLWEKHGCAAIGRDVFEAFDLIDTVNKAAEIFFLCRTAGQKPQGLSAKQLKELEKINAK